MTISPSGLLIWNVPADYDEEDPTILINVSDASGQERFHTVRLTIR